MNEEIMKELNKVKEHYNKVEELTKLIVLAEWDLRISMPKKGLNSRANTISFISGELFKLATSNEVASFIDYFEPLMDELSVQDRAMIRKMKREFAEYYGYEDNKYDALLNEYEEGLTVKKLDSVFGELKEAILNLLDYINSKDNKVDYSFLQDKYDIEKQKELSDYLLDLIQFDKEKGRLDETEHPFTTNMGNKDVRITTHYYERDLFSNIFSVIHEGGHALYEMHISDDLIGTGLAELPEVWNKKYKEYLGIEPKNDAEGVLQDMHWSDGSFGYFPSYALGNLYGCQLLNTMLKENSNALSDLKNGDLTYINNWLSDNVHKHGSLYNAEELLEKVTGEKLNPKYFIDYLNRKYKDIY